MAATKEINNMEGPLTVNKCVAQNWFRHFHEGDTSFEDNPRSERTSIEEDETLFEMVEQQLSTIFQTLSTELGPS